MSNDYDPDNRRRPQTDPQRPTTTNPTTGPMSSAGTTRPGSVVQGAPRGEGQPTSDQGSMSPMPTHGASSGTGTGMGTASSGATTGDRIRSAMPNAMRHGTQDWRTQGFIAGGLIVGAIVVMLLIGGERRTFTSTSPRATSSNPVDTGTSRGAGEGTIGGDRTNTSPATTGTSQPTSGPPR